MRHLIAVWDEMFTGSECYMLSDAELSIEDLARKAVVEYLSLWDTIGEKNKLIQQCLIHYDDCQGCTDSKRIHELGISVGEDQFADYQIDKDSFQDEVAINVRVLNLEQHPQLEQLCLDSLNMIPEELLRSTDIDFRYKKFDKELAEVMIYTKMC